MVSSTCDKSFQDKTNYINYIESSGFTSISDPSAFTIPFLLPVVIPQVVNVSMLMTTINGIPDIEAGCNHIVDVEID